MTPIVKEIDFRFNAFEAYSLFKEEEDSIFLDSSKEDSEFSRFSFIGINKFKTFRAYGNNIEIDNHKFKGDIFYELEKLIIEYKFNYESDLPLVSGCIGYFSYDAARTLESIPDTTEYDFNIPDAYFNFYDNIIIFDLLNKKTYITALGILEDKKSSISRIENKLKECQAREIKEVIPKKTNFKSNFTREEYINTVKALKEYIKSGDVYIANLTQRFYCDSLNDSFNIYESLRSINKAPFSAYMKLDGFEVISSSPERFVKIYDRKVETRPIKGTRPRGSTPHEDIRNKEELENSEKDKSELLMIVDLERNDLSKVCKNNTIKVTDLFKLETYATVFHLVSTITGMLKDDVTSVKCIRECFPGGSITGAPKIRAMEIIEELEGLKRNLYTGSIGYFDFRGNSDFNIVIRTIVKKDNKAYFGVGGGITIDSIEEDEYEETLDKAKALMKVL
ncbi:aminodeoxychorismate synthase, subunit I [Clostridium cavendishii DSM 21758]|uniref:Anthranilate synthase component 1 n=1 Tax=Clostridium cavendishii DSM 21758 TaxID=1121302 RepID=A0A1M6EVP8_9CLOT|nr:aminodeoxychorismate synthase component I [Clostridium cavendishii]SHI89480.1 aminodeoxychorismate synthase, subunit I [Clostridium cavendishii DSM 21758]